MKNFDEFNDFCHQRYEELEAEDKAMVDSTTEDTLDRLLARIHHSYGRWLRNTFGLWDTDSVIIKWFDKAYGIIHADDISSLIIIGIVFRNDSTIRDRIIGNHVQQYKAHWAKIERET